MSGKIIKRLFKLAFAAGLTAALVLATRMVRESFLVPIVNPLENSPRAAYAAMLRGPTPAPTPTPRLLNLPLPGYPAETLRSPDPHDGWICMELYSDGLLYAWDPHGVSADWEADGGFDISDRPSLIASDVIAAAAGYQHGIFLKADGSVWTFGGNDYGQLGNGEIGGRSAPARILRNCVAVASTHSTCLALTFQGEVYAWGNNACGQIGDGERGNGALLDSDLIVPAPRLILSLITRVQCGAPGNTDADDHFEAFDCDEVEYVWGGRCPDTPTPYIEWIEERLSRLSRDAGEDTGADEWDAEQGDAEEHTENTEDAGRDTEEGAA